MNIIYPNKIAWRRYISKQQPFFAKPKKQKELRSFLNKTSEHQITHATLEPDEDFYKWFIPAYREMLAKKGNPLEFDVKTYQLGKKSIKKALVLSKDEQPIGATIYFEFSKSLNIAFKAYQEDWPDASQLRIKPSMYSEFLLYTSATDLDKEYISLGIDRNPYGPNADIGLANFKFSAGYQPYPTSKADEASIDVSDITEDSLFFLSDKNQISHGLLFAKDLERYQTFQNREGITIEPHEIG